ncbi:PQQ-binding-like beta-propeller repeat protein [candidate division GN15 bacterium]|nr:PQQ-binding-like beta-propeller repeat protein [candidate division GN15 bacterium]
MRQVVATGLLLVAVAVTGCRADSDRTQSRPEGNSMASYVRLFADYQQRSVQSITTNAAGNESWFLPLADAGFGNPPTVLLATPDGLVAQSVDRLAGVSYDGDLRWQQPHGAGLDAVYSDGATYYRTTEGDLYAINAEGKITLSDFFVPTSHDRGFIYLALPRPDRHILLHTFARSEEPMPGDPPQPDSYALLLMGDERYDDWDWMHEFEGECLPGLMTTDLGRVVILDGNGGATSFDATTGEQTGRFTVTDREFLRASLDNDNNIIAAMRTTDNTGLLASYTLEGKRNWELLLDTIPAGAFTQPPAIGPDNSVLFIVGNELLRVVNGEVQHRSPVLSAKRQYITVLEDSSALLVAANALIHLDPEGEQKFAVTLDPAETVTAPAVVDGKGRVCIATSRGIRSYE